MNNEKIIHDYLQFESAAEIAFKYGVHSDDVKILLSCSLPTATYLRIAHVIGAKKVALKLENPYFRTRYVKKMRESVSSALQHKMKYKEFRVAWRNKARLASAKGAEKIKELLKTPDFSRSWSKKCLLGAQKLKRSCRGIFDPALKSRRSAWSKSGLQRTGKKFLGPLNEKMYNFLEARVANIVLSEGFTYQYEKTVPANNLNGFFSVDFVIKELPILIEVTYWDKVEQKCEDLKRKFVALKTTFPLHLFVVITKNSMRDHYKRLLPDSILVLTPNELEHFIAGFRLSKRSGVTSSIR